MNHMLISIILPIYNVEKYLQKCLNSIMNIKEIDWECILIDNGSSDGSKEIIDKYVKNFPNKFIVVHRTGGVSSARNQGIALAKGERIMFVDSDDFLFSDAGRLLEQALNLYSDKDIICFNWAKVYDNNCIQNHIIQTKKTKNYKNLVKQMAILNDDMSFCWGKIFKKDIILNNKICFDNNMRVGEDTDFVIRYLMNAKSIGYMYEPLYAYFQRTDSVTKNFTLEHINDLMLVYKRKKELISFYGLILSSIQWKNFYKKFAFSISTVGTADINKMGFKAFMLKCKTIFQNKIVDSILYKVNIFDMPLKVRFPFFCIKHKYYILYYGFCKLKEFIKKLKNKEQMLCQQKN